MEHNLDPVVTAFTEGIAKELGARLKEVWLFGSRARGDHSVDSDYDVVVVADGDEEELHNLVTEKSYAIMCAYDALVGALEYDPFIWAREKKTSLGRNILREGIKLYGT